MSSITTNVANTALHSSFSKCLIHPPAPSQIEKLRQLWKDTFGDTDTFLDIFFKKLIPIDIAVEKIESKITIPYIHEKLGNFVSITY